jgi:hypothetical protein
VPVRGTAAATLTVSPFEPSGQVPIAGWSAAKARAGKVIGSKALPAKPAPACSNLRRDTPDAAEPIRLELRFDILISSLRVHLNHHHPHYISAHQIVFLGPCFLIVACPLITAKDVD